MLIAAMLMFKCFRQNAKWKIYAPYFQLKYPIPDKGIDFACSIKPWFAVVDVSVPDIIKVSYKMVKINEVYLCMSRYFQFNQSAA